MSNSNGGSDLDVFDTIASKPRSSAPLASPPSPDGTPSRTSERGASTVAPPLPPPGPASLAAAALMRGPSRPSAPPPPPSLPAVAAPSRPEALALLASSGKAAPRMPPAASVPSTPPMVHAVPPPVATAAGVDPVDWVAPEPLEEDLAEAEPVEAEPADTTETRTDRTTPGPHDAERELAALVEARDPAAPCRVPQPEPPMTGPLPVPLSPPAKPASMPPVSAARPGSALWTPSSAPRPVIPSLAPTTVTDSESTLRLAAKKKKSRPGLVAAAAALVAMAAIGAAALLMTPRKGTMRVYVAGPQGQEVGPVEIYVDNNKVCSSSPCMVGALDPGIHDVFAQAPGYVRTATKGVPISRGKEVPVEIELARAEPASPPAEPASVHKADTTKARATFELATHNVVMRLVSQEGDARALDESMFQDNRLSIDVDTSRQWKLQACAPGHDLLEVPLGFGQGEQETSFRIELTKNPSRTKARLESWCKTLPATKSTAVAAPASPVARTASGTGTINVNSVPAGAAVLLDGKPVGRTPLSGVKVSAGTHALVFVHPEKGRKTASVTVDAGQSRGVGVRF